MGRALGGVALAVVSTCAVINAGYAETASMQKLKVNGRYLVKADNTPLFWLSDTAWFLPKVSNADVDQYLSDRAAKGFTAVLITCHYHDDVLFNGLGAFLNNDTNTPNEQFWQHIDYIVTQAEGKGLYVAITVMWAEDYQNLVGTDLTKAYNLGNWIGRRYQNNNNIVWVISGEYNDIPNWNKALYDNVASGLRAGDLGNHLITIHPGASQSSSRDFQQSSWLDFNIIQSGHYIDNQAHGYLENYELIANDYNISPAKPTADSENAYEDLPDGFFAQSDPNAPRIKADTIRRKAYKAVFAGGFGHVYGNQNVEVMYRPGEPDYGFTQRYWKDALSDPGAQQVHYLRNLIEAHSFLNRIPDQSIVVSGLGTGLSRVQATRASDGGYALIYIPSGTSIGVDLTKMSGQTTASWFKPDDGSSVSIGSYPNTGTRSFTPPGTAQLGNDWVLVLEATGPLQLRGSVSRKIHQGGAPQTFDVNLPNQVECRRGVGTNGDTHTLVFNFANNVSAGTVVWKSGIGSVVNGTSPSFAGTTMSVNVTGVADAQTITVTLRGVKDTFGQVLADTDVQVKFLLGDTTNDQRVNGSDVAQTKSQTGIAPTQTNFRQDLTADGKINSSDISLVKSRSGHAIP